MKTTLDQVQKTAIAVAALNRARKLNPERAAQELAARNAGTEGKSTKAAGSDEGEPYANTQGMPPKVAPSLYPPSLMLSDSEFAALQQRKRALGEYVMKAFAADKETDTEAE